MDEKEMYNEIYRRMLNVQTNMINAMNSMDSFERRIDNSIVVNDTPLFKNGINDIKNEVNTKQIKIKNEIIPEIQSKLL